MKNQDIAEMTAEIEMLQLNFNGGYHHTALFIHRLKRIIELERGIRNMEATQLTSLESSNETLRKLVISLENSLAIKAREVFLLEQGLLRIPLVEGLKAKVEG
jgi:hypothetical protein